MSSSEEPERSSSVKLSFLFFRVSCTYSILTISATLFFKRLRIIIVVILSVQLLLCSVNFL
jgi:hypothetical protein